MRLLFLAPFVLGASCCLQASGQDGLGGLGKVTPNQNFRAGDAPSIVFPKEGFTGRTASFIVIRATTNQKDLGWISATDDVSIIPPEMRLPGPAAVVMARKAGQFKVYAFASQEGGANPVYAVCWLTVTDEEPGPPTPTPSPAPPGPTPPSPSPTPDPTPTPAPTPPEPDKPVKKQLLNVVIFEDPDAPPIPNRAAFIEDPGLRAIASDVANTAGKSYLLIVPKNVTMFDPADPTHKRKITPPELVPYLTIANNVAAQGGKWPIVIIAPSTGGQVLFKGSLPAKQGQPPTAADLVALIHSKGG